MSVLVVFAVIGLLMMLVTLELVRARRLKERFAVIWIAFAALVCAGALAPGSVEWLSERLGFELPANLVISGGIVVLAFIAIQLSLEITRLRDSVERLTNRLAVLEAEQQTDPDDAADR